MKNIYYTVNCHSGNITVGGFSSLEDAQEYVQSTTSIKGGTYTIFQDQRSAPSREALSILLDVWGCAKTLTPQEYQILVNECGLADLPQGRHPSALHMALAASGLLSKWEDAGSPREFSWFYGIAR